MPLAAPAQEGLLTVPGLGQGQTEAEAPAPRIDPEADAADDAAIARRLRAIYGSIEGLGGLAVRVQAGVVSLSGEVASQDLADRAVRLARQVEGVVEVDDRIEVAAGLERRITPALERLQEAARATIRYLPVLLVALALFAGFVLLAQLVRRPRALYRSLAPNAFLANLLSQLVQGLVLLAGGFLALLLLDATGVLTTLLGAAGIAGLALGFALRDTVENYIASILLSLRRPFGPEDFVRVEGHEGAVVRLTARATELLTLDGQQVRIPNATVFKGVVVNYTAHPVRRFTFALGVAPDADLALAQEAAVTAAAAVPGVLAEPPPTALFHGVGESTVELVVAGWLDQRSHDFFRTRSEVIRLVLARFKELGIDLPEPTLRLRRAAPALPEPPRRVGPAPQAAATRATTRDRSLDGMLDRERAARDDLLLGGSARE